MESFMNSMPIGQFRKVFLCYCAGLLLSCSLCFGTQTDLACLKGVRDTLRDPNNYLTSWDFNNNTEGFICQFTGVECWHPDENRVLNIRLSDMGLKGSFPLSLQNCTSITGIDLSSNELNGSIPSDISHMIGFVTSLDLSSNNFSGEIPVGLANCTYLNVLKLDHNWFTGQIPAGLVFLDRLKTINVANNLLTGPVPAFSSKVSEVDYANNQGLCGKPLEPCPSTPRSTHIGVIIGAAIGGVTVAAIGIGIGMFFYYRRLPMTRRKKKDDDPEGNKWAKSLEGVKGTKVSMFEKSISKMRLSDLMKATGVFNKSNVIGSGRTGTMYKAVLEDGTQLIVKRLEDSKHSEKEFTSEMATLGNVKHPNVVPLLGFCMAGKERLLVYQYMANGSLNDQLHNVDEGRKPMEWPLRLKIGIRAARGFAWLHHNCNPRIIHRNISSKGILLDEDFEPKISDFGLARLMNPVDTHLSTLVNGEFGDLGYVAPEYTRTLKATPKGDVYSFGTLLLELVTGEKPTRVSKAPESFKGNLVEWITELSSKSQLQDAIDKSLAGNGADNEIFQFLKVACSCVSANPKERPTMFEVYQLLRATGEQYHFTMEEEILMPLDTGDIDDVEELIVGQEVKWNN
uniref:Probably inactive leucine-rich repeat receptor-like protein kinase At5g48380 n=1 Tax=Rhizophora mucronata TaxID=61149 RepID=A0A2P2MTK2_RHIMU